MKKPTGRWHYCARSLPSILALTILLFATLFAAGPQAQDKPVDITGTVEMRMTSCYGDHHDHDHDHIEYLVRDPNTHVATVITAKREILAKLKPDQKIRIRGKREREPRIAQRANRQGQRRQLAEPAPLILDGGEVSADDIEVLDEPQGDEGPVAEGAAPLHMLSCLLVFASSNTHGCATNETNARNRLFNNTNNANLGMQAITKGRYGLQLGNGTSENPVVHMQLNVDSSGKKAQDMEQLMRTELSNMGYRIHDYNRVLMFPPSGISSFTAYAYLGFFGGPGTGRVSVYGGDYGNNRMNGYLHELGHSFGFQHSSRGSSEYGDRTCVMGISNHGSQTEPYNAAKLLEADWLEHTPNGSFTATTDRTFNLHPLYLNPTDSNETIAANIPGDPEYYIAYMRQQLPYHMLSQSGDRNRVFVYRKASGLWQKSFQVANLGPGQSYSIGTQTVRFDLYGPDLEYATVSIDVNDGNTKPLANPLAVNGEVNLPASFTLTGSDSDNDPITFSIATAPTNGTLTGTVPNLTYTPDADFIGSDSFQFSVNDGKISSFATVSINVAAANIPPVAQNQSVAIYFNTPRPITLTATDEDNPSESLTYHIVSHPTRGSLSGTPPNLTYTPNLNITGSDSFTFKANDGRDDSNLATVSLSISNLPNNPPTVFAGQNKSAVLGGQNIPWTPEVISTLAWYDASEEQTITAIDGKVATWSDQSGNGNDATSTNQPTTGTKQINGLNALVFASGNRLATPSMNMANRALFAVTERQSANICQVFSHNSTNVQLRFDANGTIRYAASSSLYSGSPSSVGALPLNTPGIVGFMLGSTLEFSVNGAFEPTGSVAGSGSSTFNQIGLRGSSSEPFVGLVGEFIVTDELPDNDTRQQIEGYLAHKWNLTANLPAEHPYKELAPDAQDNRAIVILSDATATDDDPLTTLWTVTSQPDGADVTFVDETAANTTAYFDTIGTYVLRLTASDGMAESFDEITVVISDGSITYPLTVESGTGSGSYTAGTIVPVSATIPSGQRFVNWSGDTEHLADANSATTTLTMPASATTITANHIVNNPPVVFAGADKSPELAETSSPWTPAQLNPAVWFDAQDTSTLDIANGVVTQWNDKSGNNRHASRIDNHPTYRASDPLMNNLPSIGSTSISGRIGLLTPSMTAKNAYVVTYYNTGANTTFSGYPTLLSGPETDGAFRVMGNQNTDSFITTNRFNSETFKNGATTSSNVALAMPASVFKFKSGTARTQTYALGYNHTHSGRTWQGFYSEFIFTDGSENLENEQQIEGYLAHKWNLAGSLPAAHPYKTEPPKNAVEGVTVVLSDATATDDDPLTTLWTVISQPDGATVTIANAAVVNTTVTLDTLGTHVLRLTASDGVAESFDEVTITVTSPQASSPYETWAALWQDQAPHLDLSDPDADINGNGMSNRAEFLFGIDPTNPTAANPITAPLAPATGTFRYTRTSPAMNGATYTVLYSSNLRDWFPDNSATQNASTPDAHGVQTVEVTINPALLSNPRLFIRVQAQ